MRPYVARMADDSPASPLDPTDPYERSEQTFPVLPDALVDRIRLFGTEETLRDGETLFERGERSVDFFVILSGAVDILDEDERGIEKSVHKHRANQFTGELDLFNDRQILVSGRAEGETRVLRIERASFRKMMTAESDIGEIVMRAFILRRVGLMHHGQGGVVLVGPSRAADTTRIQSFLERNGYPLRLIDTETDEDAAGFLDCFDLTEAMLPVVVYDGEPLRNPSNAALADALGLTFEVDPDQIHDLAVVGAGPSGLAAAVYAASEGLDTIVLESTAPGGQAGTSSKIENYLGFPTGISGQALAGRAQVQAQKFGARLAVSRAVTRISHDGAFRLELDDGKQVSARAVVIATGARYRMLDGLDCASYEGQGIYYAATAMEANLCAGQPVVVVGGGNSAGQAAVFMSRRASHVHMLVRADGLAATMSSYLVDRIEASDRITLHTRTEITALHGEGLLTAVDWRCRDSDGEPEHVEVAGVFVMIGAAPCTEWLGDCVELDDKGFVITGKGVSTFETTHEGLFAVGDVRSGSTKRVASGVGEGSVVVQRIHQFLDQASAG